MSKLFKEPNYTVLARIYDTLMDDVNYEAWADYIDEVIQEHHPEAVDILELACGTGTVALLLDELGVYSITATDGSPSMIEKAQQKTGPEHSEILFQVMNFLEIDLDSKYDVVFMVFDSLNYLHSEADIEKLHAEVAGVLRPGGIFIYDFTTPRNSRKAISYLHNEEGISPDHYRYFRTSD
ncbi:MAG: class I SAM-dependent methyltransferase, partial [Balneolaceae bacterium]